MLVLFKHRSLGQDCKGTKPQKGNSGGEAIATSNEQVAVPTWIPSQEPLPSSCGDKEVVFSSPLPLATGQNLSMFVGSSGSSTKNQKSTPAMSSRDKERSLNHYFNGDFKLTPEYKWNGWEKVHRKKKKKKTTRRGLKQQQSNAVTLSIP